MKRMTFPVAVFLTGLFYFHLTGFALAEPLDTIAKTISKASSKVKSKQIAILPFPYHDGHEGNSSTVISEKLVTRIVDRKQFQVVERTLMEKVLSELKLQYSGAIDQESAQRIGHILGVDALLTGTLIDLGRNQIEINARLIQAESGLVLAAASEQIERRWPEEAAPKPEAAPANPEQTKGKMSAFFHEREWVDPRLQPNPQEERSKPASSPKPETKIVLSNAGDRPAAAMGEERIFDSPDIFVKEMEMGVEENSPAEWGWMQKAWESMKRRNYDQASRDFIGLKRIYGNKPRFSMMAQMYLAESYFRQGRYQEAMREARPVAKSHGFPKLRAHALYLMARSSEELGHLHTAAGLYREIVQNYPYESRLIRASGHRMRLHAQR